MPVPEVLKDRLLDIQYCGVLFSGGYDSEVLLRYAVEVLSSSNVLSLTADTPMLAEFYREHIKSVGRELGVETLFVPLNLMSIEAFTMNTDKRCYVCKKEIYSKLKSEAVLRRCKAVLDGTSTDDLHEYRPGLAAAAETGIVHPFVETRMGAKEIADLGAYLGISKENHPSDSCLATRIPPGDRITGDLLHIVEMMEAPLRSSVKGRFRVEVGSGKLLVNYSAIDEKVVERHLKQLTKIAENSGYETELNKINQ